MAISRKTVKLFIIILSLTFSQSIEAKESSKSLSIKQKARILRQIKGLEKKQKKSPGNVKINFTLGVLYHRIGNLDKSVVYLKKTNEEPTVETLKYLAKVLREKEDYLEEVRVLGILITKRPHSPNFQTLIGNAYHRTGKPDEAIEHYRAAIKKYKKHRPAYDGLIEVFRSQGNSYEMRLVLADMIKIFKDRTDPLTTLCELDVQESFLEAAVETCTLAIETDPKIAANHIYLGLAYKFQKNEKQANDIIIRAAKQFKSSEFAQFEAGQISEGQKNWEAARKYYLLGTKAFKKSARCHTGAARAYLELKKYQKSLEYYLRACKIDRTTFSDLLDAIGKLRTKGEDKWYLKFRNSRAKCGA